MLTVGILQPGPVAWFGILRRDNRNTTHEKSNAGKVDYHNMGACYDVLLWVLDAQGFLGESRFAAPGHP